MKTAKKIHVIDGDSARRAKITFALGAGHFRTQIYADMDEFRGWPPTDGLILLNEDADCPIDDVQKSLNARGTSLPIAMYSAKPSTEKIVQAMLAGALEYLEWPFDAVRLERAASMIEDECIAKLQRMQKRSEAAALVDRLSGRECDVLALVISGESNKGIARELGISPRTVEIHRANMMVKLNARSSSDAVRIGLYAGLDDR